MAYPIPVHVAQSRITCFRLSAEHRLPWARPLPYRPACAFTGELFRLIASYVPPPAGLQSPARWGTEPRIVELFRPGRHRHRIGAAQRQLPLSLPAHWIDGGAHGVRHRHFPHC
ncbi:hypothetical protein Tbd_1071 [Thiobacillus denitrificans ATCC 25259]|uniref:Uncharacterized protein n=1 Tax=Thiobacillus denitrificans (strain ATCC 25259 / T1) TaxID=292415 RepID=Q3SJX5_THIDA|nr:hypothetical protein Tbd_1071 [Thiobacillus denitrificans ATCC 25259]